MEIFQKNTKFLALMEVTRNTWSEWIWLIQGLYEFFHRVEDIE